MKLLGGPVSGTVLGVKVELCSIIGDSPQIEKDNEYKWDLKVTGTPTYSRIEELRVDFSFIGNGLSETHMELVDWKPGEKTEDLGDVGLSIGPVKVTKSMTRKKVENSKSGLEIKWIFRDINLSKRDTLTKQFQGEVHAKFHQDSLDLYPTKIFISMNVIAVFYKKKFFFLTKYCPAQPQIRGMDVMAKCKGIIPGNPEIGYQSIENPDSERILKYTHKFKEGILVKGAGASAIRNVSLRAETLATIFTKLKADSPEGPYRELVKDAGREVGERFVNELKEILGPMDHERMIAEWFKYDSTAGMGRFEMAEEDTITVKNSFAAYNTKSDNPVCCFLEGYFEGVLSKIYGRPKIVTETSCIAKGDKNCVFKIMDG